MPHFVLAGHILVLDGEQGSWGLKQVVASPSLTHFSGSTYRTN